MPGSELRTTPAWYDPQSHRLDRLAPWGMAALAIFVVSAVVAGWRYFPGFTGDHAWYLQAALRISQGEILYRDVAWAYGPLPAHVLAGFFRWLGPTAAWASLINGVLVTLGMLLTFAVTRSLLSASGAFLVTAFATLAGPSVWGGIFQILFYSYTQAIAWGAVASLAALAAALRWQQTRQTGWLIVAGLASGLAILSKPEFGLTAVGASVMALAAARGQAGAWWRYALACGAVVVAGFGTQVIAAGWQPVWRGYTGYSQLGERLPWLWGARLGSKRLLLGGTALWLAAAAIWAGFRWPRRRLMFWSLSAVASLTVLAVGWSYLFGTTASTLSTVLGGGESRALTATPANLLFLVSLPWAPTVPLLLAAAWSSRHRALPAAWWAVWSYALLSNLRLTLTGYASGLAVAPALAVLWVWLTERTSASPQALRCSRRLALAVLGGLAMLNLAAQAVVPDSFYNAPRAWVQTAIGPIKVPKASQAELVSLAATIDHQVAAEAPIFAAGWGAQWYLLSGRPNPTAFDIALLGIGMSGPEAADVERALLAHAPSAVVLPSSWQMEADTPAAAGVAQSDAASARHNLPAWWRMLDQDYVDRTPPEIRHWRLLFRQGAH